MEISSIQEYISLLEKLEKLKEDGSLNNVLPIDQAASA